MQVRFFYRIIKGALSPIGGRVRAVPASAIPFPADLGAWGRQNAVSARRALHLAEARSLSKPKRSGANILFF